MNDGGRRSAYRRVLEQLCRHRAGTWFQRWAGVLPGSGAAGNSSADPSRNPVSTYQRSAIARSGSASVEPGCSTVASASTPAITRGPERLKNEL
jgi:hypothetical protein